MIQRADKKNIKWKSKSRNKEEKCMRKKYASAALYIMSNKMDTD